MAYPDLAGPRELRKGFQAVAQWDPTFNNMHNTLQTWPPLPDRDRSRHASMPLSRQVCRNAAASCRHSFSSKSAARNQQVSSGSKRIHARDEIARAPFAGAEVPGDDVVGDRDELLMPALAAFDLGLGADTLHHSLAQAGE